jgi:hypothetical protein
VCADLDGDGVSDLILGAPDSNAGGSDAGEVRVVSGANGALLFSAVGAGPFDDFGFAVAGIGDVDGDRVPDLLVGAPQAHEETGPIANWTGYAQVLSGADGTVLQFLQGEQVFEFWGGSFGFAVASPGDVDGDGVADYAIGEYGADVEGMLSGVATAGRLHLYSGANGLEIRQLVGFVDISATQVGRSLAAAGDLDGDSVGDLLVGTPYPDGPMGPGAQEGISLVSGATGTIVWTTPQGPMSWIGLRVALGGDVDGDGVRDVLGSERNAVSVFSGDDGRPDPEDRDQRAHSAGRAGRRRRGRHRPGRLRRRGRRRSAALQHVPARARARCASTPARPATSSARSRARSRESASAPRSTRPWASPASPASRSRSERPGMTARLAWTRVWCAW